MTTHKSPFTDELCVCTIDWQFLLRYSPNCDSETIESMMRDNRLFRLGIYSCYMGIYNVTKSTDIAVEKTRSLIAAALANPLGEYLSCAQFTPDEERLLVVLSEMVLAKNKNRMKEKRFEHTLLAFVLDLSKKLDRCRDVPTIRLCNGHNCVFGKHS